MDVTVTYHAAIRYLQRVERMSTQSARRFVNLARAVSVIRDALSTVDAPYTINRQQAIVLPKFSVVLEGTKVITVLALHQGVPRVGTVFNYSGRCVEDMLREPRAEAVR